MSTSYESDWERFKMMIPTFRERYDAYHRRKITELLHAPDRTKAERWWDAHAFIEQDARTLCLCLDAPPGLKLWTFLLSMRVLGALTDDDLEGFSPELQRFLRSSEMP